MQGQVRAAYTRAHARPISARCRDSGDSWVTARSTPRGRGAAPGVSVVDLPVRGADLVSRRAVHPAQQHAHHHALAATIAGLENAESSCRTAPASNGTTTSSRGDRRRGSRRFVSNHLGEALDPHACFLLPSARDAAAGDAPAQREHPGDRASLCAHPRVARVNYPGLDSHPDRARAAALSRGGASGLVSFGGGRPVGEAVLRRVTLPAIAASLGGAESLMTVPATTSHAGLSTSERAAAGISEGCFAARSASRTSRFRATICGLLAPRRDA